MLSRGGAGTPLCFFYAIMKKNGVTILGVGNTILSDEGFGVHFINWLSERYRFPDGVTVVDGGTLGFFLLDTITSCDTLIVVDVIKVDDIPGSIYRFTHNEIDRYLPPPTSAHEVSFVDVLYQAELMDELPETIFFCIVPENYSNLTIEITATMKNSFLSLEKLLLEELSRFGIAPEVANHA